MCSASSGTLTQPCFRVSYTENTGGGKLGSANAPTGTAMSPGIWSTSYHTVDPHEGQKRNVAVAPESPVRAKLVARPSIFTLSAGQRACCPNGLPVRRWQARQWHIEMRTGSPSHVTFSCPQLHCACRELMARHVSGFSSGVKSLGMNRITYPNAPLSP